MAPAVADAVNPPAVGMAPAVADAVIPALPRVASAHFNHPSFELLETSEARQKSLDKCVRLKIYAQKGNWIEARGILAQDRNLVTAAIGHGWPTVLHVAAGTNHVHFVEELLKLMSDNDLVLQDIKGNTAFCFAAAGGNMEIVKLLLQRNPRLPLIRGVNNMTPLQLAALNGRSEMTRFLYCDTDTTEIFKDKDWGLLFFTFIKTGFYELAWEMLKGRHELAFARDDQNGETALHILAKMPSEFGCQALQHQNENATNMNRGVKKFWVLQQLVNRLWSKILEKENSFERISTFINQPSQLLFDATSVGNYEFVAALMRAYPDLIWESDGRNQTIIHIAILHRHASIFNLVHEIGSDKDIISTYVDDNDNTLLHLAAKLAPTDQLNLVSSAASQMRLELLWFEEVKKIMQPTFIKMKNAQGITPHKLFTMEHEKLLKEAEAWIKKTAESCMLVSTFITTGVFAAAFSVPGGIDDNTGNPNYFNKTAFTIFAISNSIALISSSTSILIFPFILISRYAEYDFYKRLPHKLIFGLVAQFISITSMMVTFSTSFFITYYHGLKWIPGFISILAIFPIILFAYLQFPLWSDILYSTYYCRSLFKPSKDLLW